MKIDPIEVTYRLSQGERDSETFQDLIACICEARVHDQWVDYRDLKKVLWEAFPRLNEVGEAVALSVCRTYGLNTI